MEEKVYFNNSKGDKLCGILLNPTMDRSKPIIILVHGFSSNKNTKGFLLLRELLKQKNISTFRIDIYGHGESEGKLENITVSEGVDDIISAINYLKNCGYKKVGLLGGSFGGNAGIMAAAKTNDLFLLALKSPVSSYQERYDKLLSKQEIKKWKEKGFRMIEDYGNLIKVNYDYYDDFKNNIGYKVAHLIKIPTIIVHGDSDESVPVEQSIRLSKLIPDCKLVLIKKADHRYTNLEHYKKMSQTFVEFILKINNKNHEGN